MTKEELLSLKEFGRNMGYLVRDNFSNKNAFTLRYPECSECDVVFDNTFHDGVTISFSTQTAYDIINNYSDYDGNADEFNYKFVPLKMAQYELIEKWKEYKNYRNEIEVNKISSDFS